MWRPKDKIPNLAYDARLAAAQVLAQVRVYRADMQELSVEAHDCCPVACTSKQYSCAWLLGLRACSSSRAGSKTSRCYHETVRLSGMLLPSCLHK
eukprot:1136612-Pelagomonas_calceolata.AAC.8